MMYSMIVVGGVLCYIASHSERGVTVNIPVLGTGDSGFESRHPDNIKGQYFTK